MESARLRELDGAGTVSDRLDRWPRAADGGANPEDGDFMW